MAKSTQVVPQGYATAAPWIIGKNTAKLMDFLSAAFAAEEIGRVVNPGGAIGHGEMRIGDTIVLMFDAPQRWPDTPAFIRLYVEDAKAAFDKAVKAGATPVTEVTHLAFGDRVGRVRDPFGNVWWLQERYEEVPEAELGARWGDPKWAAAMGYVQDSLNKLY